MSSVFWWGDSLADYEPHHEIDVDVVAQYDEWYLAVSNLESYHAEDLYVKEEEYVNTTKGLIYSESGDGSVVAAVECRIRYPDAGSSLEFLITSPASLGDSPDVLIEFSGSPHGHISFDDYLGPTWGPAQFHHSNLYHYTLERYKESGSDGWNLVAFPTVEYQEKREEEVRQTDEYQEGNSVDRAALLTLATTDTVNRAFLRNLKSEGHTVGFTLPREHGSSSYVSFSTVGFEDAYLHLKSICENAHDRIFSF
ncbi:hypothetical protein [Halorhodospira halochloris]|uniref:hypothetical protein n=1 Tax=Halorhodospira halochloris TaxID=1052 RepID=UPI001EE8145D|nr:hypothetical protein [Halorhodospira halochloris]MCG5549498.1 hypothetical protein [Halorhodospira halochloris]